MNLLEEIDAARREHIAAMVATLRAEKRARRSKKDCDCKRAADLHAKERAALARYNALVLKA